MAELKWKSQKDSFTVYELEYKGHHYECCMNEANDFYTVVKDRNFKDLWKTYPMTDLIDHSLTLGIFESKKDAAVYIQNQGRFCNDHQLPLVPENRCSQAVYGLLLF